MWGWWFNKILKSNSSKCILADSFFKPTDKIVSSVTHKTYSCTNYGKSYVTCNSSNIIYLIICLNCFMQYVGGPATLLKKRLWHRCFPVNFVKFLRTPISIEHLWWLLLDTTVLKIFWIVDLWSLMNHVSDCIKFVKLNRSQNPSNLSSSLPAPFTSILKSLK